jgi:hypothetical protein
MDDLRPGPMDNLRPDRQALQLERDSVFDFGRSWACSLDDLVELVRALAEQLDRALHRYFSGVWSAHAMTLSTVFSVMAYWPAMKRVL